MKLLLRRSQRSGGFSSSVIFCLDARVEFTPQEKQSIQRYRLGSQVIYNSEASKRLLDRAGAQNDGSWSGGFKSLATLALAAMKLNITIDGLERGQHVECKSLDELLGAEEAVMDACKNLRGYLETAATFDGREVVVDFATDEPTVVAQAAALPPIAPPLAAPPPTAQALPQYELVDGEAVPVRRATSPRGGPAPDSWAAHQAARREPPPDDRFGHAETEPSQDGPAIVAAVVPRRRRR